jgi:glycerol-3-phosphate dehydrogenase
MKRHIALDRISNQETPYDIIIIGGGATGLGTAVDSASRGHCTLLIEQSDFAKGTSSRSTKLVHGGVRYLQQGNISLVMEALRERGLLYRNAPHLVHNMAFVIPNYKWWEGPFYGIGMKVYDGLAGKLGLSPSRHLDRKQTIEAIPTVETEGLTGGVSYHDGQFDDSRLAVNLAQTAFECGATVINYMKCVGLMKEGKLVVGILARDEESGKEYEIRGRSVVNATGVFVDDVRRMDEASARNLVAVSQGIHLVLPKHFLPGNAAIMVPKTEDGRVMFGVPWHNHVVVGTTDTPLETKSLEPRALQHEREFVMEHAARYLTQDPTDDDVLSVSAGLRPLVKAGGGENTAALSRDHTILVSPSGLITVTGGKWTTYRKMGEDVVDQAERIAGLDNKPCVTRNLQIKGWTHATIDPSNLACYGSEASGILEILRDQPETRNRIHPDLPYQEAEVIWHARQEMARTVEDVLSRRTRALLLNARSSIAAAPRVAIILGKELGWDVPRIHQEVNNYVAIARGYDFKDPASTASGG